MFIKGEEKRCFFVFFAFFVDIFILRWYYIPKDKRRGYMEIKAARMSSLGKIEKIYEDARRFMIDAGNASQWKDKYPPRELIIADIKDGNLYTVCNNDEILAVFFFKIGEDSTYLRIKDGAWKNDFSYGVIHRIAVGKNAHGKGVSRLCFDYAFEKCGNLKIDTHRDNLPMQRALLKNGFEYCGIINLESGEERIAYQKTK